MRKYMYRVYETHWNVERSNKLIIAELEVVQETACTYVVDYFGTKKRVRKEAPGAFAHETVRKAMCAYVSRKETHIAKIQHELTRANEGRLQALTILDRSVPMETLDHDIGPGIRVIRANTR